jgi:NAD(P)-dependent dehydrogenase (short-subunit alcohol dehydrogenase family)
MSDNRNLDGKVAVVTGASQGLGEAIAYELANRGAKVVLTDLKLDSGAGVAKTIVGRGGEAIGPGVGGPASLADNHGSGRRARGDRHRRGLPRLRRCVLHDSIGGGGGWGHDGVVGRQADQLGRSTIPRGRGDGRPRW